jgi:hypothetical protein
MPDLTEILAPVIGALEADGYEPKVEAHDGVVSFEVIAGPEACEECLSPPEVLTGMISHLLNQSGISDDIKVRYPAGWTGVVDH